MVAAGRDRGRTGKLLHLCRSYGVQTSFVDGLRQRRYPGRDTLVAVLGALGVDASSPVLIDEAIAARDEAQGREVLAPVIVSWGSAPTAVVVRLPELKPGRAMARLTLTDQDGVELTADWDASPRSRPTGEPGFVSYVIDPGTRLSSGYYNLQVEASGVEAHSTLIKAPIEAASLQAEVRESGWGVFLPTYAIRTESSAGIGDYTSLSQLMGYAQGWGAGMVATLPLLPTFPDDPSPYSAVSRLFWNELFIDPTKAPEFGECTPARDLLSSPAATRRVHRLERLRQVDYEQSWRLRREILNCLARHAFASPALREDLERYAKANPDAIAYARFRAAREKGNHPPATRVAGENAACAGSLSDPDDGFRLYLNAQRLAATQIETLGKKPPGLLLDMPLGVRRDGFDVDRWPTLFANGVNAGAPPDGFFLRGQNWGFPPVLPRSSGRSDYQYLRRSLAHVMRHAKTLRVDHVMGLHRLFWIPDGMSPADGTYVRYPADEHYAIMTVESQRHNTAIVGEDLGTVPRYVGPVMRRHRFHRMYATYFSVDASSKPPLKAPERDMFAVVNTHDMPTFAAFAKGLDIAENQALGLITSDQAGASSLLRQSTVAAIARYLGSLGLLDGPVETDTTALFRGLVAYLAASDAAFAVLNLEDYWGETEPQNMPGTFNERPNWQLRARLTLEEASPLVEGLMRNLPRPVSRTSNPG